MNTLQFILNKYKLENTDFIEIPNVGRNDLATLLNELNLRVGVEVGVERGSYSEVLCKANPQMVFYGVDSWKFSKDGNEKRKTQNSVSQKKCDEIYEKAKKRLALYPNYKIIKEYSIDAVEQFEDESLCFVYIDANHDYSFVLDDIKMWSKKVRKGGIVAGHDYYQNKRVFTKLAVDNYVKENNIKSLIVLGSEEKIAGKIRDKDRSWLFVK